MKSKFYLLVLSFPLLISLGSINYNVLTKDLEKTSPSKTSSISLVNKWQVNSPAFFDIEIDNYTLNSTNFHFGYFVEFKEDNTFQAYYRASCGNDCFTSTNGIYTIKGNSVEIFVLSAQQSGFCSDPKQFSNKKMGTFQIIQNNKDELLLKRI